MSQARQVPFEQGSREWLLRRRKSVCASDIPALFTGPDGEPIDPHKTVRDLFFEKSGLVEPDEGDKAFIFRKGKQAEAELRKLFIEHTQIPIKATCFENGVFFCSLDGYHNGQILEAKLVGRDVLKQIAKRDIPEHHRIQINSQLFISESDKAFYGAKAPSVEEGVVVEIGRDEKLIKQIKAKGEAFYEAVLKGKIPPLSPRDTLFITDPKHIKLFGRLSRLKIEKDRIDAEYDELDKLIKAIANHPRVRCNDVTVTEAERAGSIDYTKIPEVQSLAKEYIERFRKKSTIYKTIRFRREA